jgi:hypothetical protein
METLLKGKTQKIFPLLKTAHSRRPTVLSLSLKWGLPWKGVYNKCIKLLTDCLLVMSWSLFWLVYGTTQSLNFHAIYISNTSFVTLSEKSTYNLLFLQTMICYFYFISIKKFDNITEFLNLFLQNIIVFIFSAPPSIGSN